MKKIAYLDIETSGLDVETDEIIRFVVILVCEDGTTKIIDKCGKPKNPLSSEVENFTCITNEMLKDCEPSEKVKKDILQLLKGATILGEHIQIMELFFGAEFDDKIELCDKNCFGHKNLNALFRCSICGDLKDITTKKLQNLLHCEEYDAMEIEHDLKLLNKDIKRARTKLRDKNFFKYDKEMQEYFLYNLAYNGAYDCGEDLEKVADRIMMEVTRIKNLDMIATFVVARAISKILSQLDEKYHFFGIGCASLVAYLIGITEEREFPFDSLHPIKNCFIFERAFSFCKKNENIFNFYMTPKQLEIVQKKLVELFGMCEKLIENSCEIYLCVYDVKIKVYLSLDEIKQIFLETNLLDNATVGVFQEDYMWLLSSVGMSDDEINEIRKDIIKKKNLNKHRENFVKKSGLSIYKANALFDNIVQGLLYARSKAWYLSIKKVCESNEIKKVQIEE